MQKISRSKKKIKIYLERVSQISETHCGPAVLQMLLSNINIKTTQEEVTKAAGAEKTIGKHGMRVEQLAKAVEKIAPAAQFWYKNYARIEDIRTLLYDYSLAVGVEWQGMFVPEEEEDRIKDYGHYSVVIDVDDIKKQLVMADPYKEFANQDRIISINKFVSRWWDTNEIRNKISGKKRIVKDIKLLFVVALKEVTFLHKLGLKSDLVSV